MPRSCCRAPPGCSAGCVCKASANDIEARYLAAWSGLCLAEERRVTGKVDDAELFFRWRAAMTDILYTETLAPWWSAAVATAFAIAAVPIAVTSVPGAVGMLVGAASSLWFGRARYVVSTEAVEVWVGFGWPHLAIAAADVTSVALGPKTFFRARAGGWGYRGSWTLLKRVAISLGGRGWVDVETRTGHRLQLSTNDREQLLSSISTLLRT